MFLVIIVIIVAIVATMIIGETGYTRVRMANIADGAVISGAAGLCRTLNQIRMIHKQLFLNYIKTQVMLLVASFMGVFQVKPMGYIFAWTLSLWGIQQSYELFSQAEDLADSATKDLRGGLFESCLGGALIDEQKPFRLSEVVRDAQGRISGLDYNAYLNRDSNFTTKFRALKTGGWYGAGSHTYYWNRSKDVVTYPGGFTPPAVYDSYLTVQLNGVPSSIDVEAMPMILIFLFCQPCFPTVPCCYWPGFVINPWAWIRSVDLDSDSFGVTITKSSPFRKLPFFPQDVVLSHTNQVHVSGSVWSGFDFRMES